MRLFLLGFIFMGQIGFAQMSIPEPGPLFGPEFTFGSPHVPIGDLGFTHLNGFVELATNHLIKGQPDTQKFTFKKHPEALVGTFHSPNGWSFKGVTDIGVVEVVMNPMTVDEYQKYAVDIQDAIFTTAANVGLQPMEFLGGGHINIDFDYLYNRPLLLRNFLADLLVNHVELSMGIFGYDTNNAIPMVMIDHLAYAQIAKAFTVFDGVEVPTDVQVEELIAELRDIQDMYSDDPYIRNWDKVFQTKREEKFYSFRIVMTASQSRLEYRAVRPQASMDVWIRQIRLLRNRLRYLEMLDRPIPLKLPLNLSRAYAIGDEVTKRQMLTPPITASAALKNFKLFVEESGEKIEDHLDYAWPQWKSDGSLAKFVADLGAPCEQLMREAPKP